MFWLDESNPRGGLCFADKTLLTNGVAGDQSYYRYCGSNTPGNRFQDSLRSPHSALPTVRLVATKPLSVEATGSSIDSTESREIDDSGDLYPYISRTTITQSVGTTPLLTTNQLFPPLTTPGAGCAR